MEISTIVSSAEFIQPPRHLRGKITGEFSTKNDKDYYVKVITLNKREMISNS